jgi:hypothetical protein
MTAPLDATAWALLDELMRRLGEGTLRPEEIPPPAVRTQASQRLDELERSLFAASPDDQRVMHEVAAIRLVRRLARDEPNRIAALMRNVIARTPVTLRVSTWLEALRPNALSTSKVH